MPAGDGSRSSTPGSVVDGRVMFASHSSPLNSPTLASYPPISSPQPSGPPLGSHTLFSGAARYTPPPCGAHRYVSETSPYRLVSGSDAVPDPGGTRYLMDPYRHQDLQRVPVEYHRAGDEIYHNNHPIDLQRSPNATPINFQTATSIDHHRAPNSTPIDLQRAPNGISINLEQRSPSDANSVSFHRAPSIDIQRVLKGTPIDLQRPQSATLIDYQRAHSANSTDFHRTQSAASVEFQRAPHGNSINLQRGTNGTSMDLHRSSSTTSVDLQRVSNSQQQLLNAQRLVSELQRVQGGPQQRQRIHDSSRVSEIPALPVSTSSESLQRHEVHSNSLSSSSMYRVLSEPLHSPAEVVPQRAILRGTHADPQRLVQESFRGYFTSQRHALSEGRSLGDTRLVVAGEDLRYAPPDRVEDERYAGGHLMGEEPSHTMMPENLRIGNQQLMPENLCGARGADTPHSAIAPEVLRGAAGGAETPHSMITENLRGTPDASRMVPENLCLSEPTHHPQGISGVAQPLSSSNGDVAAGRMLNHSQGSAESPMPLMRSQYDPSPHKMIVEASVPPHSQSPPYSDIIYRNDLHGTFGSHLAPPTPAPSVPPSIPDQVSTTTLPQYYSPYPPHSTPSVHQYPPYISEEPDSMSLEEKIERGYQDIKPFDQDYPVSMPMMHMSQDILQVPPPTAAKPPKPKKPKEPKPPRLPIIHKCNECLRVFKNSTQLKNHMWRHTGEKPFTCDECGSKFTQQGNLRAHRRIHTGERPYQCPECKACFTQLSTLKTHQKIHSDERPYKCSECDAAFRQVANLKTHQVTHTGERPHKCDQCDKAFTQKSNLKAHKNRVHYGEGISVPVKRGRKKIPAAIKPFECPECGARFTVLSNLKIHSKLHSGDKQLECEACGAGFAQRSNLRNHMQRIHGRPPPIQAPKRRIKCDECPAMFKLRRCLKTHKRRRHPIKSLKIKILRESRYHLNSSLVEALPEEEDDNEEEDGSLLDSMAPSLDQSHTDGEDVYESGFNSTDEDSIAHFQRDNQGDLPSSAAEPIVQIREPKVERPDSPLSPETTSLPLIGSLEAKQEVFDNPGGTSMGPASEIGHKNFFQMETHSALPSLHTDHPLAVEVNDVYTRNDCGEASSRSLSCENAALNHPLSSNFESKDISVKASEGS